VAITRIILWIGYTFLFCAALMIFAALTGLAFGELSLSGAFLFISLIIALFGGILAFTTRSAPVRESSRDAMVFLLLFWILTPFVLCLPIWAAGVTTGPAQAFFETVSAFTTTGASALNPDDLPATILLWRAILQFCGGVVSATFAVVILAALNLSGTGVHRSKLFTLKTGEMFSRLLYIGRIVGGVYATLASLCFALLLISGHGLLNSVCLSLSAISTGGLTPQDGTLSTYVNKLGVLALAVTCVFGAANLAIVWDMLRLKTWDSLLRLLRNFEHRGLFVFIAILIVFGFFYAGLGNMFAVVIESIFMVTTAGFDYAVIGIDIVPPSLLIMCALVGGCAISTAGGLKMIRLLLLISHASTDVGRLSHPSKVKQVHFRGAVLKDRAFMSVWMYFFGYTLVFAAGIVALGAAGISYPVAVSAGAAALSNFGPLLDATFPLSSYSTMNPLQMSVLSVLMLLGRVEVLAALAAFAPSLWRS